MGVKRTKQGMYVCNKFVSDHNHILHMSSSSHFLQSHRNISVVAAHEIDLAEEFGLDSKATFEFLAIKAGGKQSVRYMVSNLSNYLRTKSQKDMAFGDAGRMLYYFERKARELPSYFCSYQFDNEEQITNIFWADAQMIIDYTHFGDVVTFEMTFATNKENRPFEVFCGFNHHRNIVIFGASLLYDETVDSFKWLFETFLKAHKGRKSITIFTDQDARMTKAISEVILETRHGLCTWHIYINAVKHMAQIVREGSSVLKDFKNCMYGCENEDAFESAWLKLVQSCLSNKRDWFNRIYKVKNKWTTCFMKNTLTLDMCSTQPSESFNSDLKDYLKSSLNVVRFLKQFDRVVAEKRDKEAKANFDMRDKLPLNEFHKVPIMKHAADIYTPKVFSLILEEYRLIDACFAEEKINNLVDMDVVHNVVIVFGKGIDMIIHCTCKKYERMRFLCCHALRVLDIFKVRSIPENYILKRWTKSMRDIEVLDYEGSIVLEDPNLDSTHRYQNLCVELVTLALKASETEEGYF